MESIIPYFLLEIMVILLISMGLDFPYNFGLNHKMACLNASSIGAVGSTGGTI